MRYLSVCSGIESVSLAWAHLGWEPVAFAEIDPFPSAVLAHRFPHVPNLGDFTKIEPADVGPIDLLVGGTPCQGFSVAGKRLGLDDPRSNLALQFCLLARRLKPRWVVWENVPGVHSSWSGAADDSEIAPGERWEGPEDSDFRTFLDALEECGYPSCWRVLDAQFTRVESHPFAVPQRRERVFLVGYLGDWRPPAAVLLEPEGLRGDPPPRRQAGQAVACSLGAGSARSGGRVGRREAAANHLVPEHAKPICAARGRAAANANDQETYIPEIAGTLNHNGKAAGSATQQDAETGMLVAFGGNDTSGPRDVATALSAKGGAGRMDFDPETFVAHALRGDGFDASEDGTGRGTPIVPLRAAGAHGNHDAGIGLEGDPALTLDGTSSMAIAFDTTQITSKDNRCQPVDGGPCHPLSAHAHAPALALHTRQDPCTAEEVAFAHDAMHPAPNAVSQTGWAVRRLTPRECERLMGMPDGWTDVPYRGRKAADGPRYKALGNSKAVNCVAWIGERIALCDRIMAGMKGAAA